jgi:integrase
LPRQIQPNYDRSGRDFKVDFDKELEKVNVGLKAARVRVSVFIRDNRLWLRATLPPKPMSVKLKPHQQYVSLGARCTLAGLKYADGKAKEMAVALDLGKFNWDDWVETKSVAPKTFGEVIEAYHAWRLSVSKLAPSTWKTDYLLVARRFPQHDRISLKGMMDVIVATKPDSRGRKRVSEYCCRLASFAGFPDEDLERLGQMTGKYSAKSVNPRCLPSDVEIFKFVESIESPGWKWVCGVIATYGVRSHEAVKLSVIDFPKLLVPGGTKTGERIVRPIPLDWNEKWELGKKVLPDFQNILEQGNDVISTKISKWFYLENKRREINFHALDLRHCYARRCFEFGFSVDVSARFMGHSPKVHRETYQAWIGEKVYDDAYWAVMRES